MGLTFSPLAEDDLSRIEDYVGRDSPERALSFIARLRGRCAKIAAFPEAAPLRPEVGEGIRMVPFGRYLIFYKADGRDILIVRIVHGARDYSSLF
jgi:toxin ParE1/3/4